MDGEHAFSTSLTLVLVNVAFPYNERDAVAMEVALSILRDMAGKGNEYIQARLAMLTNLRASMQNRAAESASIMTGTSLLAMGSDFGPIRQAQSSSMPTGALGTNTSSMLEAHQQPFQPFQDITFDFDVNDDTGLWEEISGNIDINMDTSWIENTLRKGRPAPYSL